MNHSLSSIPFALRICVVHSVPFPAPPLTQCIEVFKRFLIGPFTTRLFPLSSAILDTAVG